MNAGLFIGIVFGAVVLAQLLSYPAGPAAGRAPDRRGTSDTGSVFALAGVALGLCVLLRHPGPVMEKLGAAGFAAASVGLFLKWFAEWLWQRCRLGPRLLTVRPPMGGHLVWAVFCAALVWGGIDELARPAGETELYLQTRISYGLFCLAGAVVLFLWVGFSGIELREHGCVTFFEHATWSDLESYRWRADAGDWLTLELNGRSHTAPAMTALLVPISSKAPFDDVLRQHISDATVALDITAPEESMPWADASTLLDRGELAVAQRAFRSELEVHTSDGECLCRVRRARLGERFVMDEAGKQKFMAIKESASPTAHRSYQIFGPPFGEMLGCVQLKRPASNEWEILDAKQAPIGRVVRDASAHDLLHVRLHGDTVGTIERSAPLLQSERSRVRINSGVLSSQQRFLLLAAAILCMSVGVLREVSVKRVVHRLVRLLLFLSGFGVFGGGVLGTIVMFVVVPHPEPGYWQWIFASLLLIATGSGMMLLAYRLGKAVTGHGGRGGRREG